MTRAASSRAARLRISVVSMKFVSERFSAAAKAYKACIWPESNRNVTADFAVTFESITFMRIYVRQLATKCKHLDFQNLDPVTTPPPKTW